MDELDREIAQAVVPYAADLESDEELARDGANGVVRTTDAVRARVRALIERRIAEAEARGAKKAYDDVIEWCKTYRGGGERGDAYDDAYLDVVEECGRYAERRAREEKP